MFKIDEDRSYARLFFVLAAAFALVTAWAVYEEGWGRREYKKVQKDFFRLERDIAAKNLSRACFGAGGDDITRLRMENLVTHCTALGPAHQNLTKERDALRVSGGQRAAAAEQVVREKAAAATEAEQELSLCRSCYEEAYYEWTQAKHQGQRDLAKRQAVLDTLQKQLDELRAVANRTAASLQEATQWATELTARGDELTRQLEQKEAPIKEALHSYLALSTTQENEVVQRNLPELGRVDRCETCHMAAARPGFETVVSVAFRSHPYRRTLFALHPVEKFGCTTCHGGQGEATTQFFAHAPPGPRNLDKHFFADSMLHGPEVESNCLKCHSAETELRSELRCESDAECTQPGQESELRCRVPRLPMAPLDPATNLLSLSVASDAVKYCVAEDGQATKVDLAPHLSRGRKIIDEAGCTGCHAIAGFAAHKDGPDLRRLASKFSTAENRRWLEAWIRAPHTLHARGRMPNFFPTSRAQAGEESSAMAAFLVAQSTPLALRRLPGGSSQEHGRARVTELGCISCHELPSGEKITRVNRGSHFDHAPDLSDIGSKTTVEWIYGWLKDPKAYAPGTKMPSFRLSDQEALDVAAYLANSVSVHAPQPVHPERSAAKSKGNTIEDCPSTSSGRAERERLANSKRAMSPTVRMTGTVAQGKWLVEHYGCHGCHEINGFETRPPIGVDLSDFGAKDVTRLDFGDAIVDPQKQSWEVWTENKLRHPRLFAYDRAPLRMPEYEFSEEEIADVKIVLKGLRGRSHDAEVKGHELSATDLAREQGRDKLRAYNCAGCHTVDSHGGEVRSAEIYSRSRNPEIPPPALYSEGAKTQPNWLFHFLKAPSEIRPSLKVRMPTFGFSDVEATQLVAMFSALDGATYPYFDNPPYPLSQVERAEAATAFQIAECVRCHPQSGAPSPVGAPALLHLSQRLRGDWLLKWLENPAALNPSTTMPSFFSDGGAMFAAAAKNDRNHPDAEHLGSLSVEQVVERLRNWLMTQ